MAKLEQEQLVEIFSKAARVYAALMMYYDNLADDRMEYAAEEITIDDVNNAQADLEDLDEFITTYVGFSADEIIEQY